MPGAVEDPRQSPWCRPPLGTGRPTRRQRAERRAAAASHMRLQEDADRVPGRWSPAPGGAPGSPSLEEDRLRSLRCAAGRFLEQPLALLAPEEAFRDALATRAFPEGLIEETWQRRLGAARLAAGPHPGRPPDHEPGAAAARPAAPAATTGSPTEAPLESPTEVLATAPTEPSTGLPTEDPLPPTGANPELPMASVEAAPTEPSTGLPTEAPPPPTEATPEPPTEASGMAPTGPA